MRVVLLIEVEAGNPDCGDCHLREGTMAGCTTDCRGFKDEDGMLTPIVDGKRCRACLDSEILVTELALAVAGLE